jgi:hypothetical protein
MTFVGRHRVTVEQLEEEKKKKRRRRRRRRRRRKRRRRRRRRRVKLTKCRVKCEGIAGKSSEGRS